MNKNIKSVDYLANLRAAGIFRNTKGNDRK
jgi:hypothetical protein